MTEAEWLACADPTPMLEFLRGKATDRKLRLLTCAFFRRRYAPGDPRSAIIRAGERYADGTASREEVQAALNLARRHDRSEPFRVTSQTIRVVVCDDISSMAYDVLRLEFLALLPPKQATTFCLPIRDIFGNPFRPVTLDPAWATSTVLALAQGIYADRAFDRLPILADALQDAGCEDADILDHCRSDGPHVRGCWVVDLVLGKS
jgi:hypothetical protein